MTNQLVVKRYVRLAEDEYSRYNIPSRLFAVMDEVYQHGRGVSEAQAATFDRIHLDAYTARRLAERKCRKLNMGGDEWSPQGQDSPDRIFLWRMLLKGRRSCRVSSRKIRRLMKRTDELEAWRLPVAELERRLSVDLGLL